jgi:hypothetical protein
MAETQTRSRKESDREEAEGNIEYVDMGDWTLEIDRRLPQEVRRRIPKAQRGVALDTPEREELRNRLEVEQEAAKNEEPEEFDVEKALPPERKVDEDEPESITVSAKGEEKGRSRSADDTPTKAS